MLLVCVIDFSKLLRWYCVVALWYDRSISNNLWCELRDFLCPSEQFPFLQNTFCIPKALGFIFYSHI